MEFNLTQILAFFGLAIPAGGITFGLVVRLIPKKTLGKLSRNAGKFFSAFFGRAIGKIHDESIKETVNYCLKEFIDEIDDEFESKKPEGEN